MASPIEVTLLEGTAQKKHEVGVLKQNFQAKYRIAVKT